MYAFVNSMIVNKWRHLIIQPTVQKIMLIKLISNNILKLQLAVDLFCIIWSLKVFKGRIKAVLLPGVEYSHNTIFFHHVLPRKPVEYKFYTNDIIYNSWRERSQLMEDDTYFSDGSLSSKATLSFLIVGAQPAWKYQGLCVVLNRL